MKVVWTRSALADLDDILAYTADRFPSVAEGLERRIRATVDHIGRWPESARMVEQRPDVRVCLWFATRFAFSIASSGIGWRFSTSIMLLRIPKTDD
jgi:plasmid stabilization system protein ParE